MVLQMLLPSSAEDYAIPASAISSNSRPSSNTGPGPAEKCPAANKPPGPKRSTSVEVKRVQQQGQYTLVGTPDKGDGYSLVSIPQHNPAPKKAQSDAYSLVGIPESNARNAVIDSVSPQQNHVSDESKQVLAPSPAPASSLYSVVGTPALQKCKSEDAVSTDDSTYSTVQNCAKGAFSVTVQAPLPPSVHSMPTKSKSSSDIMRRIEDDKQKLSAGDVTLQQGNLAFFLQ